MMQFMAQERLFNPGQFSGGKPRPGQMTPDEWMETQNPVFHGSFRRSDDWEQNPVPHFGTRGQATTMVHRVGNAMEGLPTVRKKYFDPTYDGEDGFDEGGEILEGRVFARRLDRKPTYTVLSDAQANSADMNYRLESGQAKNEIPQSIKDSIETDFSGPDSSRKYVNWGTKQLSRGRPITYHNSTEGYSPYDEDTDSTSPERGRSVIAPKGSYSSWEEDVMREAKSGGATRMAESYAKQRTELGVAGSVGFPANPRLVGEQLKLGDTLPADNDDHYVLGTWHVPTYSGWQDGKRRMIQSAQFRTT